MIQTPSKTAPWALLSVTDKTGVASFAKGLVELGFQVLSTGGTAALLRKEGIQVTDVSSYTGSPEILGGRVKTLHPKIHGGILMDRDLAEHRDQASAHRIGPVDLVAVNLYEFRREAVAKNLSLEEAIEHIDIGGPTMIRAAAKNWRHCLAVTDPADYPLVLEALKTGEPSRDFRLSLASKAFALTVRYDAMISSYFESRRRRHESDDDVSLPGRWQLDLRKIQDLRYGENPHQKAALYGYANGSDGDPGDFGHLELLQGKELSYNNILDLDAAAALISDFKEVTAAAVFKHTNPCGCAVARFSDEPLADIYRRAFEGDPRSAFGGIVALNTCCDEATAKAITSIFTECVIAPAYSGEALQVFSSKQNLRLLKAPFIGSKDSRERFQVRSVRGGVLVQSEDRFERPPSEWRVVTKAIPQDSMMADLEFALTVAKHVKSNAIIYAKNGSTLSIGAGQMSRIDAAVFAATKAKEEGKDLKGAVMASEAFFPFRDTVDLAASYGISAIIQPGGSKRDEESISAADDHGIAMVFTGERHFKH